MLKLNSPAKINLFLRVVGKRSDGFHELSSLFQAIDLMDVLTFEKSHEDRLTCTDPTLPTNQNNLVLKALNLFRQKTGIHFYPNIHLDKRIPAEAGLGGGSSNAATTLWACNQLTGQNVPLETLQAWSAEIGSDIPFFFSCGTAHCTGRGEIVKNLNPLPSPKIHIVKPEGGLSTPAVYGKVNLNSYKDFDVQDFISGKIHPFNDLEQPAFEIRPELKNLKLKLQAGGFDTVLMSGSGSSFFCLGEGQFIPDSSFKVYKTSFILRLKDNCWY